MHNKIIAIASHKGGVGKTSMSCWLADAMARSGLKTIVIDGDPQGAASDAFGWDGESSKSLAEWYSKPKNPTNLIWKEHSSGVHLVPNTMQSFITAHKLEQEARSAKWAPGAYLKEFVSEIHKHYDLILLDTPPHWDIHLLNCLRAAETVFIPLAPDAKSLKGVQILLGLIVREQEKGVDMPTVSGLCIHRTKARTKTCRDVNELIRSTYGAVILKGELADTVAFAESDAAGMLSPLTAKPNSSTAEQILELTAEIGERLATGKVYNAKNLSHIIL